VRLRALPGAGFRGSRSHPAVPPGKEGSRRRLSHRDAHALKERRGSQGFPDRLDQHGIAVTRAYVAAASVRQTARPAAAS